MDRAPRRSVSDRLRAPEVVVAAAFLLSALIGAWLVRPFHVGTIGFDAAASVLHFERITSGRDLEALLGATPKALLTMVYGLSHAIDPEWRAVSWLAIGAYASGIAAAAALAVRMHGWLAAGFATVGLAGSAELLQDVDLAYAVSWALVCWALAGLFVTGPRPRFALAGTSGATEVAIEKPSRARMPVELVRMGASVNSPMSVNATMSSSRRRISSPSTPRNAPARKTLSRPVSSCSNRAPRV